MEETATAPELRYLDGDLVRELCRTFDPLDVVRRTLWALRGGRAAIAEEAALRWTAPDGTAARSLVLPAWHGTAYGCKVINACVGNPGRGLDRAHGLIILFDQLTAVPVCVMEGARISALRTAAVSVAAVLAVRDPARIRQLALLGCGRLALTHAELLVSHAPVATLRLFDLVPDRARRLATTLRALAPGTAVEIADSPRAAMAAADVTVAATTTTTPYVRLAWLAGGAVFVNVSLDDATDELLTGCDHLFVDDWSLVSADRTRRLGRLAGSGRVVGPGEPAGPDARPVDADLPCLASGAYSRPVSATDRVVVNPFGMGVHDIAFAARVYEAALAGDVGVRLPR